MAAVLFALATAAPAQTGDTARGKTLYNTWCAGCHGADPRQSQPNRAANRPDVLRDTISLVAQMNFLKTVLTAVDIADIAAYIGSFTGTGVPLLSPTPGTLEFSQQTVGIASPLRALLLTNLASMALTVESVETTPGDFTASGNCTGRLNRFNTCALDIGFTPSAAGPIAGRVTVRVLGDGLMNRPRTGRKPG